MPITQESQLGTEFERLHDIFTSSRFLKMEGLGNEVPFFIWPFPPTLQPAVDKAAAALVRRLHNEGHRLLVIDLFDLVLEILKGRGIFDKILEQERRTSKDRLLKTLQSTLDSQRVLVPAMREKAQAQEHDLVFVTGVGLAFPFVRTHSLLNNIQRLFTSHPLVLFFPGEYRFTPAKGSTLNIFGCMPDDRYYRAFDLNQYTI